MKKLSKLQINAGRILKNKDLEILRGGYGWCDFYWADYNWGGGYFENQADCENWLWTYFSHQSYCSCR
ncbi:MAG TPA: hypothetical protein PK910_02215 [Bacteroidales bacterium]|nr:hypothetical protein [Bacteroidales bacterium]